MCPPCATPEATLSAGDAGAVSQTPSKRALAPAVLDDDAEYFAGVIKSYNDRRGFGFLACEETARRFGRDVYLSKVESQAALCEAEESLKEGDHVQFAVLLSIEGFPQAAGVQRLQVLRGTVLRFCSTQGGAIACEAAVALGIREVPVRPCDCGRLLLCPGDEVSFCLEASADGTGATEARLVQLVATIRPPNAMLGCFSMEMPRILP